MIKPDRKGKISTTKWNDGYEVKCITKDSSGRIIDISKKYCSCKDEAKALIFWYDQTGNFDISGDIL